MVTLNEVYSEWLTTGAIFKDFQTYSVGTLPWASLDPLSIDALYMGNHAGDKPISPLVSKLLSSDGTITTANREKLAKYVWLKYNVQWAKLYALLSKSYNPIENYSMTEELERETTNTGTQSDSGTNTETVTHGKTLTTSGAGNVYGFNSSTAQPVSTESGTNTEGGTTGTSGTDTNTRTDNLAGTEEYTLTRSGNIGVTTSQQMMQSEIDLWAWNFWETVFQDIDRELTIGIYEL